MLVKIVAENTEQLAEDKKQLAANIKQLAEAKEEKAEVIRLVAESVEVIRRQKLEMEYKDAARIVTCKEEMAAGAAKIALKGGGHAYINGIKINSKTILKGATSASSQQLAKQLPLASVIVGVAIALERYRRGQTGRAIGEVISGFVTTVPIGGIWLSVALDAVIFGYDCREDNKREVVLDIDVKSAHKILEIDESQQGEPAPTREAIERAFRKLSDPVHPDRDRAKIENIVSFKLEAQKLLLKSREVLLRHYKYTQQQSPQEQQAASNSNARQQEGISNREGGHEAV
jgi:hypothetical protein